MVLSQSRNGIKNLKKQIQMGPRFHEKFEKATEELDASVVGLLRVKTNTLYIYIWGWVKTLVPSEPQNS